MVRAEIQELVSLGAFPSSQKVDLRVIRRQEELLNSVKPPISDEEARELVKLFGSDEYYGAAWTVLHLIETAPGWPIEDCLADSSNEWITRLNERLRNRKVK
jgi:hypothetical protein